MDILLLPLAIKIIIIMRTTAECVTKLVFVHQRPRSIFRIGGAKHVHSASQ